jgi:hypothetical protein
METYTIKKNEHKFKPCIFKMQFKPGMLYFDALHLILHNSNHKHPCSP